MPKAKSRPNRRRARRGLTLIEASLVLGILAITMGGIAQVLSDTAENQRSKAAADRMTEILAASQQYMQANQTALTTLTTGGGNVSVGVAKTSSTGSDPGGPGGALGSLQAGGFLPSTYLDVDAYGQNHRVVVKQVAAGTANAHLEGMVVSTGGMNIPDRQVGRVARFIGEHGGFMAAKPVGGTAGSITGVAGGWITPAGNWAASGVTPATGHVMASLSLNDNALAGDYLNRYNIGVPEANTLHTDVHFGGNKIDNLAQACSGATSGSGCVNDGSVLSIGPNISIPGYLQAGGDVSSGANVSAAGVVTGGTGVVATTGNVTASTGAVVGQTGVVANTGNVTASTGSVVAANDVDAGGNANVQGTVYTNGLLDYGNSQVNGSSVVAGNENVGGTSTVGYLHSYTGVYVDQGDIGTAQGNLNAPNGTLYVNNGYDGQSYVNNLKTGEFDLGTVVYSDGDGRGLAKTDGIRLGDLLPHYVSQYQYMVYSSYTASGSSFGVVPKPTCGSGGVAKVSFSVLQDSMFFTPSVRSNYIPSGYQIGATENIQGSGGPYVGNVPVYETGAYGLAFDVQGQTTHIARQVGAVDIGNLWQMAVSGEYTDDIPVSALAQTSCYYP